MRWWPPSRICRGPGPAVAPVAEALAPSELRRAKQQADSVPHDANTREASPVKGTCRPSASSALMVIALRLCESAATCSAHAFCIWRPCSAGDDAHQLQPPPPPTTKWRARAQIDKEDATTSGARGGSSQVSCGTCSSRRSIAFEAGGHLPLARSGVLEAGGWLASRSSS